MSDPQVPVPPVSPVGAEDESDADEVTVRLDKMEKYLGAVPGAAFSYVARNYLVPLLRTMHSQYGTDIMALWEEMGADDGTDEDEDADEGTEVVVEGAKSAIVVLSSLMDNLMVRLGYVKEGDVSSDTPPEVVAAYQAARAAATTWAAAYKAWLGEDEEEQP